MTSKPHPHTTTQVTFIPNCDYCLTSGIERPAYVDGVTRGGGWAYMCEVHYQAHGVGLGLGRGQKLILKEAINGEPT